MASPFRAAIENQRPRASGGGSSYAGAASSRLTAADWIMATIKSADQEVRADLRTLRARSRELVRNNDTAARYAALVDEQVVGPDGIRLQAHVTRPDGMLDLDINQRIEDAWLEWCEPLNCTVDGRMGWVDVLSNWANTTPQDGEWLLRMVPFRGNRFGFALQTLDADQLDHEYHREPGNGRNEIRMGVEIDRWSRPVAHHVWDHHPSEYTARGRERVRIPAEQIVHWYRSGRVGLTRGVPWYSPALFKMKMMGGYEEAEVTAARMAAAKGGFFETEAEAMPDPNAPNAAQQNQINFQIEPGRFDRLPPGWTFKEWDPKHPTSAFSEFHKAMLRGIASGLGVSYVSLANDLENVNFSSIRAGLLNERDAWKKLQRSLVRHVCVRVYREWLKWSLTTGALRLPSRNEQRWHRHQWQPRGWPWVDPEKDIDSRLKGVGAGVDSLHRICGETGVDFEEVLMERALEIQLAKELGVPINLETSKSARRPNSEEDQASASASDVDSRLIPGLVNSRALATLRPERAAALAAALTNGNGRHE